MKTFFTADLPIKITNETTNNAGAFKTNTLISPSIAGTYKIQAHFNKIGHYNGADFNTVILKVEDNGFMKTPTIVDPTSHLDRSSDSDSRTNTNTSSDSVG